MRLLAVVLLSLLIPALAPTAEAGGSGETTLLVVNEDSPLSVEVGRRYAALRGIPTSHICPLKDIPSLRTISMAQFRARILLPILAFIETQGLGEEIDLIAYSVDFPFAVSFQQETKGKSFLQVFDKPRVASLTGLTCLFESVVNKDEGYLTVEANKYLRTSDPRDVGAPHGFRHRYLFDHGKEPEKNPDPKEFEEGEAAGRYFLSMALGHTAFQGNTHLEVLQYLRRGAASDGTSPDGTVYLMENKNVRATTRMPFFEATTRALAALGRSAVTLAAGKDGQDGITPKGKTDVLGVVAGFAQFDWPKSGSRFVDGAIAEHLTSFGGRLDGSGQTKITEYLRHGACGSAGTVAEPYALWFKFPLPYIHVYYAAGCSMAESFYSSVASPYQLLMLGDPLARPFARFATVTLANSTDAPWSGTVELKARVTPAKDREGEDLPIRHVELWLDGQYIAEAAPDAPLSLDTTRLANGPHALRLVAVEDTPIETRSVHRTTIQVANGEAEVTIRKPRKEPESGAEWDVLGKHSGAERVELFAGHRSLGEAQVRRTTWKIEIDPSRVGSGPVEVFARATFKDGATAISAPLTLDLAPGMTPPTKKKRSRRRRKDKGAKAAAGKPGLASVIELKAGEEREYVLPGLGAFRKQKPIGNLIAQQAKAEVVSVEASGEFLAPKPRLATETPAGPQHYRLAIRARGALKLTVGGRVVFDAEGLEPDAMRFVSLELESGWHPIQVQYAPGGHPELDIAIGGACTHRVLDNKHVRH